MHMLMIVASVLIVALMAGFGLAAVTTGWVIPLGRHRVLRPRLWGYGQLAGAVGISLWMFLGTIPHRFDALPLIGWLMFMAGLGVQMLAQRPGRTPRTGATKSAS
ncbi:hypothetical protein [Streptomyces sp. NK08204]|uniref:hypothetical protein n=1 Tax=Streptomyces sp. NK08204 TaxID=2873260 RepID=UPI001CEDF857|nr:hypothetical protein [Streptomyces sp. NK08204]